MRTPTTHSARDPERRGSNKTLRGDLGTLIRTCGGAGRYSNFCDQGERLRYLLQIVTTGPSQPKTRTKKQFQNRLSSAESQALVTAYLAGGSVYGLADQFHVHRNTVSRILEKEGVPRRYRLLQGDTLKSAITSYQRGQSLAMIGQEQGISLDTVRAALTNAGVRLRPRPVWHY
jgi:hypothetical protein